MKIKKIEKNDTKSLIFILNNLSVESMSFFESDLIIININKASAKGNRTNFP